MPVTRSLKEWQEGMRGNFEELEKEIEKDRCSRCGLEIEGDRIEITKVVNGRRETRYYHIHCWASLSRVKTFQISFVKSENPSKPPKLDVTLDGQIHIPSTEAKKMILQLCDLLETEYQHQRK